MAWTRYNLTESQIQGIANLCQQEQGTIEGARAEACLMANLLEGNKYYHDKYGTDIYSFARNSGWFSRAAYWMDNGTAGAAYRKVVADVLADGKRVYPPYIDEHDSFADISSAKNNGTEISKKDRSEYRPGVTQIRNRFGSSYTFHVFPTWTSDPFGYTRKTEFVPTAEDVINRAETYLGMSEPSGDDYFIRVYDQLAWDEHSLNAAWCAMYVTVVYFIMGCRCVPVFDTCTVGRDWYVKQGRYMRSKAYGGIYTPKKGDTVFYSSKKLQEAANHVGIVVSCDGERLRAIEGNHANAVGYRDILLADNYIIGYGKVADYLADGGEWEGMDVRRYVRNLYVDELFRVPTKAEEDAWISDVNEHGRTPGELQDIFRNSPEGREAWVRAMYGKILHREARPDEVAAWVAEMEKGKTREDVMKDIESSPEAQALK